MTLLVELQQKDIPSSDAEGSSGMESSEEASAGSSESKLNELTQGRSKSLKVGQANLAGRGGWGWVVFRSNLGRLNSTKNNILTGERHEIPARTDGHEVIGILDFVGAFECFVIGATKKKTCGEGGFDQN